MRIIRSYITEALNVGQEFVLPEAAGDGNGLKKSSKLNRLLL